MLHLADDELGKPDFSCTPENFAHEVHGELKNCRELNLARRGLQIGDWVTRSLANANPHDTPHYAGGTELRTKDKLRLYRTLLRSSEE